MNFLPLLIALIFGWKGGWTRGDISPSQGLEYLLVGEDGVISALTSGKNPSLTDAVPLGKFILSPGERITYGPWFEPADDGRAGGVLWVQVLSSGSAHLRGIGLGGTTSPVGIVNASLPVLVGSQAREVAWIDAGVVKIGAANSWKTGRSLASPGFVPQSIASFSDSLLAFDQFGRIGLFLNNAWTLISSAAPQPLTDVVIWRTSTMLTVAGIDATGLVWTNASGAWLSFDPGERVEAAAGISGQAALRVRGVSGRVMDYDLTTNKRRWVLRSPLQRLGFFRSERGIYSATEVGDAPAGLGILDRVWSHLYGLFHHRSSMSVGDLEVDPEVWAPRRGAALVRLSSSGGDKTFWTLDVVAESSATAVSHRTLKNREQLLDGWNDAHWVRGNSDSSGSWWVRALIWDSRDSIMLWHRIILDDSAPSGVPFLLVDTLPLSDTVRLGRGRLSLSGDSINDIPVGIGSLRGAITLGGTKIEWNPADSVRLDRIEFADGVHSLAIVIRDSAGNQSSWHGPWHVVAKNGGRSTVSWFSASKFRAQITGLALPIPVRRMDGYRTTIRIRVAGLNELAMLELRAPDNSVIACGEGSDLVRTLAVASDTTIQRPCVFSPGNQGWISGLNTLRVVLRAQDDTVSSNIAILLDSAKTTITYPTEGAKVVGTVDVRGIATSPTLGAGFTRYRAWFHKGIWNSPRMARDLSVLLGDVTWSPMPVPLASQAIGNVTPQTRFDGRWPKSNIGVQDVAGDGLLAWFSPNTDSGNYTLLVATEVDNKLSSWDVRHVSWQKGTPTGALLVVVDSNHIRHPDRAVARLDLRNSVADDDSLVWTLQASQGILEGEAILYRLGTDGLPSLGRIWDRQRIHLDGSPIVWCQQKASTFGEPLDSGVWHWRFELNDIYGHRIDTLLSFIAVPQNKPVDSVLSVAPSSVTWTPGTGSPEPFRIRVVLPLSEFIRLDVFNAAGVRQARLVDSSRLQKGVWNWRADTLLPQSFSVRLSHLVNGVFVELSRTQISLRADGVLINQTIPLLDVDGDSLWNPSATTKFKVRAKAEGRLQYFPDRLIDYAPISYGDQAVRKFLTVPWGVDYIKFYNSVEIYSNAYYLLRAWYEYAASPGGEHRTRESYSGDRRQTLWAPRWDDRWMLRAATVIDSAKGQFDSIAVSTSLHTFASSPYFGDKPWIPLGESEASTITSPEAAAALKNTMEWKYRLVGYGSFGKPIKGYPDLNANRIADSLARAGNHACNYLQTINLTGYEEPNHCKVTGPTEQRGQPKDEWKGIDDGWLKINFAKRGTANPNEILNSRRHLYFAQGMSDGGIDPRIATQSNLLVQQMGREAPSNPRVFWQKRQYGLFGYSSYTSYDLSDGDWEDEEEQGGFTGLPNVNWNSPYLLLHGRLIKDLNYAAMVSGDSVFADPFRWDGQANETDLANCEGDTTKCLSSFGGTKVGLRGFGFQPNRGPLLLKDGRKYSAYRYIPNYFDRTRSNGMIAWAHDVTDPKNTDTLQFQPRLDISDSMMGVTWDTLRVPYPFGAWTEKGDWQIEKRDDQILAHRAQLGVSHYDFKGVDSQFLKLSVRDPDISGGNAQTKPLLLDSVDIPLDTLFASLLAITDTGFGANKAYGYVFRKSLRWQIPLRSWRVLSDGSLGGPDVDSLFHSVRIIDTVGSRLIGRVYYRNVPSVLGNWSSETDTAFRKTNGWLFGSGSFNDVTFRGRNPGLMAGFRGLIRASNIKSFMPSSVSPFVRKSDSSVAWNPNIDLNSLRWNMDVYYADGETPNADLQVPNDSAPRDNFDLQLEPRSGSRSWIPLRGSIPDTVRVGQETLRFRKYQVKVRRQDDTSAWRNLAVNRFFTPESLGGESGTHLPNDSADPWQDHDSLPALTWWDVTSIYGKYEVMVLAEYRGVRDTTPRLLMERRQIHVGTTVGTDSVTVHAPYQRAELLIPAGTQPRGTSLQLVVVPPSEFVLPASAPFVAPLGPVLRVLTDGNRTFSSYPTLIYRMSAREVFALEHRTDFDSLEPAKLRTELERVKNNYRLHVLSVDGQLNVLPTLVTVAGVGSDREALHLTLQASVPHFSWVFVQKSDAHDGRYPRFVRVTTTSNGVEVVGTAEEGAEPGRLLYQTHAVPTDLVLSWTSDTGSNIRVVPGNSRVPLVVGLDGMFQFTLPWDSLAIGSSTLLVSYASSSIADRRIIVREDSALIIGDFSSSPGRIAPNCGTDPLLTSFHASRRDSVVMTIWDSLGTALGSQRFSIAQGMNQIPWDGCVDGRILPIGSYRIVYAFPSSPRATHSVPVGLGTRPARLEMLRVSPVQFVPSLSDTTHGTHYLLRSSGDVGPVLLRVRSASRVLPLRIIQSLDSLEFGVWNGREGTSRLFGTWHLEALVQDDTTQRVSAVVQLLNKPTPSRIWSINPDTLKGEALRGQISLSTSEPLMVSVHLLADTVSFGFVHPVDSTLVTSSQSWNWSGVSSSTSLRAVARWHTKDGLIAGIDTIHFARAALPPAVELVGAIPANDTIWMDLDAGMRRALGVQVPDRLELRLRVLRPVKAWLKVVDAKGRVVRRDTLSLSGEPNVVWNGLGARDSLLRAGRYQVSLLTVDSQMVYNHSILLHRLPDLVLVSDSTGRAQRIALQVASMTNRLVQIWPDSVVAAYMQAKPEGAVVLAQAGVDSMLMTKHPWNPVFRFVRAGGRLATLGGFPGVAPAELAQGDSVFPSWLALTGFVSPYADSFSFLKASTRMWSQPSKIDWVDSSVTSDIGLFTSGSEYRSRGLNGSSLEDWLGVWMPLAGQDTLVDIGVNEYMRLVSHHSVYVRPSMWKGVEDSSGAILAVHPYSLVTRADSLQAETDLARLIVRFFFSNDLYLSKRVCHFDSDTIRPGNTIVLRVAPQFNGETKLDSARIRVVAPSGHDTILVFRGVKPGSVPAQTVRWAWDSSWTFGPHSLFLEALPFEFVDPETGDTIREGNLSNNRLYLPWTMADTAHPKVIIDSVANGRLQQDWSARADGRDLVVRARATVRHSVSPLTWRWRAFLGAFQTIQTDETSTDSAVSEVRFTHLPDSLHGRILTLQVTVRDAFGNEKSVSATVRGDSSNPVINAWEITGAPGDRNASNGQTRDFSRKADILTDTLLARAVDDCGIVGMNVFRIPNGVNHELVTALPDTSVMLTSGASLRFQREAINGTWYLNVCDRAGNCSKSWFRPVRDTMPPLIQVWKPRKFWLDSLLKDSSRSPNLIQTRSLLLTKNDTARGPSVDLQYADLLVGRLGKHAVENGSWTATEQTTKGQVHSFLIESLDEGGVSQRVELDGQVVSGSVTNSYLRVGSDSLLPARYWQAVDAHTFQRFFQVTITRPRHEIKISSVDSSGRRSVAILYLETSEADLQVIDSANEPVQGADWGEVYMRRDHFAPTGATNPETWDFWLVQRRNALQLGEVDNGIYRLIVDVDSNASTGDQSLSAGLRGADIAIEWGPQTRADDGSAVRFRKLVWDSASSNWIPSVTRTVEGQYVEEGIGLDINQSDDPNTDSVGEGDQRLPRNTIARATGGLIEIGLRNGNSGSLQPIRWAIVPVNLASDTVQDSVGGMLVFTPPRFQAVKVDALASDWWPDQSSPELEAYAFGSQTVPGRIRLRVRNTGTVTVDVAKVTYWIHSVDQPVVALDSIPGGRKLVLSRVEQDSTKGLDQWRVEITCGSCLLVGGLEKSSLGQLLISGAAAAHVADDWSYSTDSGSVNAHVILYAPDGHILWGSEPPTRVVREPLARIIPQGPIWARVGQPLSLSADSSFDPEGQQLLATWRFEDLGRTDTGKTVSVTYDRPGLRTVSLEVRDRLHPLRKARATLAVYVEDLSGGFGTFPVKESTLVVFDDQWNVGWSQEWPLKEWPLRISDVRVSDSVWSNDGSRVMRTPVRGDSLLSLPFDSTGERMSIRVRCDSTYWKAQGLSWCQDGLDLTKFTNLEFWVASDAGLRRPLRIWITYSGSGQGNSSREDDFGYVTTYLPDASRPQDWQHVSIPLAEIFTEPERPDGWLKLKIMPDDPDRGTGAKPRILLDQIELVRYSAGQGEIVTTRRSGLQVLANTSDPWPPPNQLGMTVRLLNASSIPVGLDSLRVRTYFRSRVGEVHGDTAWGLETPVYESSGMPIDSTLDAAAFGMDHLSITSTGASLPLSSHRIDLTWAEPGHQGLSLRPTASAMYWIHAGSYNSTIHGFPFLGAPLLRYAGTRSLHWSWPDSADIWQFAPHIVIDGRKADGTWGRIWGLAPDEDPQFLEYWNRESLRDPSQAVTLATLVKARIRILSGAVAPGGRLVLTADSSYDPLGHPLTYHWLDAQGRVLNTSVSWALDLPQSGELKIGLRVFDATDIARQARDSMILDITSPGVATDSLAVLRGPNGPMTFVEAWGPSSGTASPQWLDSVTLPVRDGMCPVRLRTTGPGKILRIPFGRVGYTGVRFALPRDTLTRSRWTHLEFWVASDREFAFESDRERPLRIWMTHQIAPASGADNHASEEDFGIVQTYLAGGQLKRSWQKVSIPLDELIQESPINNDTTKWFLKLMKHWSFRESDTARDADLLLSGMALVHHGNAHGRVTTRRVGALALGSLARSSLSNGWTGTLRVMNPTPIALRADSIRIRMLGNHSYMHGVSLMPNQGDRGSDESVSQDWYNELNSDSAWSTPVTSGGRQISGEAIFTWNTPTALNGLRGWQGLFGLYNGAPVDSTMDPWFLIRRNDVEDILLHRVLVEHRQSGGAWKRLWGVAPLESWTMLDFDGRDRLLIPSDTALPLASVEALSCNDTVVTPPDTTHPPRDTSSIYGTTAGSVSDVPSMGRDGSLSVTAVTVQGQPAVQIYQSRPDWSVKHTFSFDTAWARGQYILIDILVPAAQLSATDSYVGSLSVSTFDGQNWIALNPNAGVDLGSAVGSWKTIRFSYDHTRYVLGQPFDVQLLANGHAGNGSTFTFDLGSIRLDRGGSDTAVGSGTGNTTSPPITGISMDSLQVWSVCNGCLLAGMPNGGLGISVLPTGGEVLLEKQIVSDTSFRNAKAFEIDIHSNGAITGSWETITIVLINSASAQWDDSHVALIPQQAGEGATVSRLRIPFDGTKFLQGTTTTLQIFLNANTQQGNRILLDNLKWVP